MSDFKVIVESRRGSFRHEFYWNLKQLKDRVTSFSVIPDRRSYNEMLKAIYEPDYRVLQIVKL